MTVKNRQPRILICDPIAGTALDVFKVEPALDNPLVAHDNVIVSSFLMGE